MPEELEDELLCTNLDVVVPKLGSFTKSTKLPVLVWIHGMFELSTPRLRERLVFSNFFCPIKGARKP